MEVGLHNTRRVWAFLTERPNASLKEIAQRLQLTRSTVWWAIERLEQSGYIRSERCERARSKRARVVLVPLVTKFRVTEAQE